MSYGSANQLTNFNGTEIAYDADGNMLKTPLGEEFGNLTFDSLNQLTDVTISGSAVSYSYTYDAEGYRIAKDENGVVTNFTVNPNADLSQVLMSTTNGETTYYVYGLGLISQENSDGYKLYHYDYRGSTTAITNLNGEVTDTLYYDPYGNIVSRTGNTDTPFLYVGQYGVETDDSGLYYMRARYYNPQIQRFINVDPIRDNYNWYAYADGNSISSVDPTGTMDWSTQAELYMHGFWDATVDFSDATKKELFSFLDNPLDYIYDTGKDIAGGIKDVSAGIVSGEITPLSIIGSGAGWIGKSVKGIYDWGYKWSPFTTITDEEAYQLGYSGADTLYDTSEFVVKFATAYKGATYIGKGLSKLKIKIGDFSKSKIIHNDILDSERIGSALKVDEVSPIYEINLNTGKLYIAREFPATARAHGFNDIVDNYAGYATKTPIKNGILYQLEGSLNGVEGRFEWIIQNEKVTHRMFVQYGTMNGVPIRP